MRTPPLLMDGVSARFPPRIWGYIVIVRRSVKKWVGMYGLLLGCVSSPGFLRFFSGRKGTGSGAEKADVPLTSNCSPSPELI